MHKSTDLILVLYPFFFPNCWCWSNWNIQVGQDKQRRRRIKNDSCCLIKSWVIRCQHFVMGSSNSSLEEWNLNRKTSELSEFFVFHVLSLSKVKFYFTFVIHNVLGPVSNFIKLSNRCVFLGNVCMYLCKRISRSTLFYWLMFTFLNLDS